MKLTYLGHSAFLVEGEKIKALIDPFITDNPQANISLNELKDITHIFVTHSHGDHLGDTVQLAKDNDAIVMTVFELGQTLMAEGIKVCTMHIGGRSTFDFGSVKMTPALHGSGLFKGDHFISGGNPCGFLIEIDRVKLYHAGDTGLTLDMQLLAYENVDVAILPIGGKYTMDITDAVRAVEFIEPKVVVPMHYNTFPGIKADPQEFVNRVEKAEVIVMGVGETIEIE